MVAENMLMLERSIVREIYYAFIRESYNVITADILYKWLARRILRVVVPIFAEIGCDIATYTGTKSDKVQLNRRFLPVIAD